MTDGLAGFTTGFAKGTDGLVETVNQDRARQQQQSQFDTSAKTQADQFAASEKRQTEQFGKNYDLAARQAGFGKDPVTGDLVQDPTSLVAKKATADIASTEAQTAFYQAQSIGKTLENKALPQRIRMERDKLKNDLLISKNHLEIAKGEAETARVRADIERQTLTQRGKEFDANYTQNAQMFAANLAEKGFMLSPDGAVVKDPESDRWALMGAQLDSAKLANEAAVLQNDALSYANSPAQRALVEAERKLSTRSKKLDILAKKQDMGREPDRFKMQQEAAKSDIEYKQFLIENGKASSENARAEFEFRKQQSVIAVKQQAIENAMNQMKLEGDERRFVGTMLNSAWQSADAARSSLIEKSMGVLSARFPNGVPQVAIDKMQDQVDAISPGYFHISSLVSDWMNQSPDAAQVILPMIKDIQKYTDAIVGAEPTPTIKKKYNEYIDVKSREMDILEATSAEFSSASAVTRMPESQPTTQPTSRPSQNPESQPTSRPAKMRISLATPRKPSVTGSSDVAGPEVENTLLAPLPENTADRLTTLDARQDLTAAQRKSIRLAYTSVGNGGDTLDFLRKNDSPYNWIAYQGHPIPIPFADQINIENEPYNGVGASPLWNRSYTRPLDILTHTVQNLADEARMIVKTGVGGETKIVSRFIDAAVKDDSAYETMYKEVASKADSPILPSDSPLSTSTVAKVFEYVMNKELKLPLKSEKKSLTK